jgi:hypothetical protein
MTDENSGDGGPEGDDPYESGEGGGADDEYDQDDDDDDEGGGGGGYPGRSRRFWVTLVVAVVVVVGIGLGLGLSFGRSSSTAPVGPEGVPVQNVPDLASPNSTVGGAPVDGITCRPTMEQADAYHVHVHVAIFVDGKQRRLPAGAGIVAPRASVNLPGGLFVDSGANDCLYWLHVHADDGIIHVEAPSKQNFTLGQFFDIWGQPLGPDQVGPARGTVVAFLNGTRFAGNPRNIPLLAQGDIQLDVGSPVVAFKPLKFQVVGGLCSTSCSGIPSS